VVIIWLFIVMSMPDISLYRYYPFEAVTLIEVCI
jgi:hypothetical protein